MHYAFGDMGELEEAMRRANYERFNEDIRVRKEIINEIQAPDIEKQPDQPSIDDFLNGEIEYSEWLKRDGIWWANK